MQVKRAGGARGFTLIETIVVMLIVGLMVTMGLPALQQMIHRSRLEGATRECAVMCQRARLEAIKQSVPAVVRFDTTTRTIESWLDADGDGTQDPTEVEIMVAGLPGTVNFIGPAPYNPIEGFDTDPDGGWVTFFSDGSVDLAGEVHFGDARGNFLELRINPRATGNIEIRKWDGTDWVVPTEDKPWKWK